MKAKAKLYGPMLLAALLCALVFATGAMKKPSEFELLNGQYMQLAGGKTRYAVADGDAYGALPGEIAGLHLPAGEYHLRWMISGDGDNVLVHRDFAMQNGLSVGSTFRLRQEGRNATVRVAGIFSGNVQAQSPLPSDTSENLIYSGRRVASALTGNDRIDMIRCLSDNPQDLSAAIGRAKTMAGGKYDVTDDSARLSGVLQSVQTVRNLVRMVLLSVCLADVLVLAMALVFWIRSRIHEIGTLLALGIDKMRIVAQLAIETGLMAAVAALCSLGTGAMLSGYVSSRLLRDSGVAPLESLHVEALPPEQTMLILLLGCAVIAVALAVSCAAVLSKSPKSILSSMR